jgi:hypothetical protein
VALHKDARLFPKTLVVPHRPHEPNHRSSQLRDGASNFASAAAGGFVGMGILPDDHNDLMHAEQRMTRELLEIATRNIATEFAPRWGPWAKKNERNSCAGES